MTRRSDEETDSSQDRRGTWVGVCSPCGSIDAKPSGFGISADSALGVMELMIGGGGMRNLPTTMPSGFRPPDHSSLTNNDAGVSVDI